VANKQTILSHYATLRDYEDEAARAICPTNGLVAGSIPASPTRKSAQIDVISSATE
jgi:hypothetical protein